MSLKACRKYQPANIKGYGGGSQGSRRICVEYQTWSERQPWPLQEWDCGGDGSRLAGQRCVRVISPEGATYSEAHWWYCKKACEIWLQRAKRRGGWEESEELGRAWVIRPWEPHEGYSSSGLSFSILYHLPLLLLLFGLHPEACGIFFPWPEIIPTLPCIGRWSLNHWTTGEVSSTMIF